MRRLILKATFIPVSAPLKRWKVNTIHMKTYNRWETKKSSGKEKFLKVIVYIALFIISAIVIEVAVFNEIDRRETVRKELYFERTRPDRLSEQLDAIRHLAYKKERTRLNELDPSTSISPTDYIPLHRAVARRLRNRLSAERLETEEDISVIVEKYREVYENLGSSGARNVYNFALLHKNHKSRDPDFVSSENDSHRSPDMLDRLAGRLAGASEEEIQEFANDEFLQAAKDVAIHETLKEAVPVFFDKATENKWDKFMETGDKKIEGE